MRFKVEIFISAERGLPVICQKIRSVFATTTTTFCSI